MSKSKFIETELKFKLNVEEIERFKSDENISVLNEVYQKTVMFDNADKLMERTDGRIRLRQHGDKITISYKRPLPSVGSEKKEIELETTVGDIEVTTHILRMMGYSPTTSYAKYTTHLKFKNSGAELEIQKYPFATFLEIEGEKEEIEKVAKELELDTKGALNKPVDTLFCEWREKKGLPFKSHMRFEDYDK
jgi:predicted adenylyl cyclase CyaB